MAIKKENTETRRGQIVAAVLEIIGEEGVQGLTTSRIAKAVGVSEANLYRHFENKDAILNSVVDHIDRTLSENLKIVNAEPITPIEKLEKIFNLHISMIQDNRGIPRVVFSSETILRKGLREKMDSLINSYLKMVADILKKGISDSSIKPGINPAAMAAIFIGIIQICVLRWTFSDFQIPLFKESRKLWQAFRKIIEEGK